jgi:hypothetical protein
MSTIINQSLAPLSAKNPLFQSPEDEYGNIKFVLNAYSAEEFETRCKLVTYSLHFQRYYMFNNPPGDKGHPWQQNLFANMITYQPLGTIEWVNTITSIGSVINEKESMDGQQRTKTYLDIRDNKVRLPKNTFIYVDGERKDVSGLNFKQLWQEHTAYVEAWLKGYIFVVIESILSKGEKHKRFIDVNDQNALSDQDKRSSLDNPLTHMLNPMTIDTTPAYNFLKVDTDKMEFYHIPKLPVTGKTIQEVISKVLVYGFADKFTNIGKSAIDSLYDSFSEDGYRTQKDIDAIYPLLNEVLSTTNYIIEKSASRDFWKKRDVMILMIVIWDLFRNKKKFDSKLLKGGYMKVISDLKRKNAKLNEWAIDNGFLVDKDNAHDDNKLAESIRERDNTFAACYTAGDSPITLQFTIETIKSKLFEVGIVKTKDSRRVFTKEEKQQIAHLQNGKCLCCGETLDVDNTTSYEGDHIIPYSEGGKTELDNCEVLCLTCHQSKTTNFEFYKKMRSTINVLNKFK